MVTLIPIRPVHVTSKFVNGTTSNFNSILQKGIFLIVLTAVVSTSALAQKKNRPELTGEDILRKGLLRAQATLSPGWTLRDGNTNLYLQGDMEYFVEDRISIKGDLSYFLDTQGNGYLKHNHSLLVGAQYHFPYKRFDPYLGFAPGISLIQAKNPTLATEETPFPPSLSILKVSPAVSVSTGFNYYVWRYIHFMVNLKYVHAAHTAQWGTHYALDELRVSFGLGWNVNLKKKHE